MYIESRTGKDMKGSIMTKFEVLTQHLSGRIDNLEYPSYPRFKVGIYQICKNQWCFSQLDQSQFGSNITGRIWNEKIIMTVQWKHIHTSMTCKLQYISQQRDNSIFDMQLCTDVATVSNGYIYKPLRHSQPHGNHSTDMQIISALQSLAVPHLVPQVIPHLEASQQPFVEGRGNQ